MFYSKLLTKYSEKSTKNNSHNSNDKLRGWYLMGGYYYLPDSV